MVSVINTVDTGHVDMIHDAQMDFYGTRLATCSSDRSIKIFEVKGNVQTLLAELHDHEGPVWQVAWAHPMYGNILSSCSYDKKVLIYQEDSQNTWRKIYEYAGHESSINSVCWAPHQFGLVLACASSDGSVSVLNYSADTWEAKKILNAHSIGCNSVSWMPALPVVKVDSSAGQQQQLCQRLVTGGCDGYVKIWRLDSTGDWREEHKLEGHSDWVRDVACAPSIGLPKSVIASCSQDRRVIIWSNDGITGQWQPHVLNTFDDVIWHVSWSVTGNILAVSGGDNKISLWKETLEGQWVCLSDSTKGRSLDLKSQSEQRGH